MKPWLPVPSGTLLPKKTAGGEKKQQLKETAEDRQRASSEKRRLRETAWASSERRIPLDIKRVKASTGFIHLKPMKPWLPAPSGTLLC